MDTADYERQLHLLLGVQGPIGFLRLDGCDLWVYRLPDGGQIQIPPAASMTPAQRAENLERLRTHLGLVAQKRKPDDGEHH